MKKGIMERQEPTTLNLCSKKMKLQTNDVFLIIYRPKRAVIETGVGFTKYISMIAFSRGIIDPPARSSCCRPYLSYVLHLQCVAILSLDPPSEGGGQMDEKKDLPFFTSMPCFWYIISKKVCFQTPLFTSGETPK